MSPDRLTKLAYELMRIGVSQSGVQRLLLDHDLDEVERQLAYLPYRQAKRPEAFIVQAIRNRYSPPKEFFYAANQAHAARKSHSVDQNPEHSPGSPDAIIEGHGVETPPDIASANGRMESFGTVGDPVVQDLDEANREAK